MASTARSRVQLADSVISVLVALAGVVAFSVTYWQQALTAPVAGVAFVRDLPDASILLIEVFNPGPGPLESIALEVTVPERWDAASSTFSNGLFAERSPNTDVARDVNGRNTRIVYVPAGGVLRAGARMSVVFESPTHGWRPTAAVVTYAGKVLDASKHVQTNNTFSVLDYLPAVLGLALLLVALTVMMIRPQLAVRERARMQEEVLTKIQDDLDRTRPPRSGTKANDQFEEAIKRARSRTPRQK